MSELGQNRQHYWVNYWRGLQLTFSKNPPEGLEDWKYLGWTKDTYWPKTLNTGRILHKIGNTKTVKKVKKRKEKRRDELKKQFRL